MCGWVFEEGLTSISRSRARVSMYVEKLWWLFTVFFLAIYIYFSVASSAQRGVPLLLLSGQTPEAAGCPWSRAVGVGMKMMMVLI